MTRRPDGPASGRRTIPAEIWAYAALLASFAAAIWLSADFPRSARLFPQLVGIGGALLCLWAIARQLRLARTPPTGDAEAGDVSDLHSETPAGAVLPYLAWMVGLLAGAGLVGFLVAATLISLAFLLAVGRVRVVTAVLMTALAVGVTASLGWALNMRWPSGIL